MLKPDMTRTDSMGIPILFSAWLRYMRERKNQGLPEAAKRLKMGVDTLQRLESGKKVDMKLSTLRKIHKAYGGTMFNLFLMYDKEFPE